MGFFSSQYDSLPECVILYNTRGNIKYINESGLKLFKYPKGVVPKTIFELMEEKHRNDHVLRIPKKKGMFNKDIKGLCYDGSLIQIDISIIPRFFLSNIILIKQSSSEVFYEYKTFFNLSNHGMFISKNDGTIVNCNDNFANAIEYNVDDIVGRNFLTLVYEKDIKKTIDAMEHIKTAQIDDFSNRYVSKSGKLVDLSWKVVEKNEKYYGTAENITDKIKLLDNLQQSNIFLKEIEELSLIGSWDWCIDTNELIWSDGLKAIYELEETSYDSYLKCNHPDDLDIISKAISDCINHHKKYTIIHRLVSNKTKTVKWLKATGKFCIRNDKSYIIGVAQEISEQVKIEEDLRKQKELAEEGSKIKSSFVASVSHEIRTPVHGILGMVSLLETTEINKKQKEYISILNNSCGILLSIINNILDFSKIESGRISLDVSQFNVRECFNKTLEIFKIEMERKGLKLIISQDYISEIIYCDEVKIRQIFSNILTNSIKFTKSGSITVKISVSGSSLNIVITDTGIGISDEFLNKITSPFTQESSGTTRNYGGSGLGLSIVSSYVNILKGKMSITSKIGIGTETAIYIPLQKEIQSEKKYIVIVEDNFANQYILKEMLSKITSYNILCFDNGMSCVDNIKSEPLIIFMDIHMPKMDGHASTIALRKRGFKCPIIALTANNITGEREKCLISGMTDFAVKPINLKEVERLLKKHL